MHAKMHLLSLFRYGGVQNHYAAKGGHMTLLLLYNYMDFIKNMYTSDKKII